MNQEIARKKILFLITKATYGGAQKYVYDLATRLPKEQFTTVIAYGEHGKLADMLKERNSALHHIPSLARDIALISDVASFFGIVRLFGREKPDIVHLNSSKAAALGALAARIAGVPNIIFSVHGWPFKEDRTTLARRIIFLVSWCTALFSHRVIVVSKADEHLAKRMWGIGKKTVRIPIGIESLPYLSREHAFGFIRSEIGSAISETALRFVTIAELTENKGISYGIGAIATLRDRGVECMYVVIGDGEEKQALEKVVRDHGLADRVFFVGFIPDAALYLKGFDVCLLPSVKEGMPYVVLEAAAAGIPVVTTTAVHRDVAARFPHIQFVEYGDIATLADMLMHPKAPKM